MNMLNAIHLLGYGGMRVTGPKPTIGGQHGSGFDSPSRLVGFLGVGTPRPPPRIERAPRDEHVREWRA